LKNLDVFKFVMLIEVLLIGVSLITVIATGSKILFGVDKTNILFLMVTGLLCGVLIQGLSAIVYLKVESFRRLHRNITIPALNSLSVWQFFLMALASGVGEELFFRGILQPRIGIVFSNVVFAFLHMGTNKQLVLYGMYTFVIGVILGILYTVTKSILTPAVCHFTVNFLAGVMIKYGFLYK